MNAIDGEKDMGEDSIMLGGRGSLEQKLAYK